MKTFLKNYYLIFYFLIILFILSSLYLNICDDEEVVNSDPSKLILLLRWLFLKTTKSYVKIIRQPQNVSAGFVEEELNLQLDLKIHVFGISDLITKFLIASKTWESHHLKSLTDLILLNRRKLQFIDLGCKIGVFTLNVANLGVKVVAVDQSIENLRRLNVSVEVNKLGNFITVLLNGISSKREKIFVPQDKVDIGLPTFLRSNSSDVWSIYLDDIRYLLDPIKPVVIKVDIYGSEIEAFKKADRLFNEFKIGAILMEWDWTKNMNGVSSLINFFTSRSYLPYEDFDESSKSLNLTLYKSWSFDIVWRKKGIFHFL